MTRYNLLPVLLDVASITLVLGLLSASQDLIALSFSVIAFIVLGVAIEPPRVLRVARRLGKDSCAVGDLTEVRTEVLLDGGPGVVLINDETPEGVELVEGSNKRVCFKRPGLLRVGLEYTLKPVVRGEHVFRGVRIVALHPVLLRPGRVVEANGGAAKLVAAPRLELPRRGASLKPLASKGLATKWAGQYKPEVKEVRVVSSSYANVSRLINWRATAKLPSDKIAVNVLDRDVREDLLVVLDNGLQMLTGRLDWNPLEASVSLTLFLSGLLINNGVGVGLLVLSNGEFVEPGRDTTSFQQVLDVLRRVRASGYSRPPAVIKPLVERLRRSSGGLKTLVVSNLVPSNMGLISETLRVVNQGGRPVLIDASPYSLLSNDPVVLGQISYLKDELRRKAGRLCSHVIAWDIKHQSIPHVASLVVSAFGWGVGGRG